MKTSIALFALIASTLAIIGCAGTPVAVDRFSKVEPVIRAYQPAANNGAVIKPEIRPFFIPNNQFGALNLPGFYYLPAFALPYNPDASLTLLRFNNFQFKLIPMAYGGF